MVFIFEKSAPNWPRKHTETKIDAAFLLFQHVVEIDGNGDNTVVFTWMKNVSSCARALCLLEVRSKCATLPTSDFAVKRLRRNHVASL